MSELTAAMQAALESVDDDRHRRRGDHVAGTAATSAGVRLRAQDDLPPIVARQAPATFTGALRELYGPTVVAAWAALREAALMVVLFWVCAILLAFVEVEGAVHVPGVGDATVVTVAVAAAALLRTVLAAASRSASTAASRRR